MNSPLPKDPTLWLELCLEEQRRVFEIDSSDAVVTVGTGKHASFRIPAGPPVSVHFEARGPVIHIVRGYAKALKFNGEEVEREALLLGSGKVQCEGFSIDAMVHLNRPEGECTPMNEQPEQGDVHVLPTAVVARPSLPYDQQQTVALDADPHLAAVVDEHSEQSERHAWCEAATEAVSVAPEAARDMLVLTHASHANNDSPLLDPPHHELTSEEYDPQTAIIGTVPDFEREYPGYQEQAHQEQDRQQPSVFEGVRSIALPLIHMEAAPAPERSVSDRTASDRTEGIPLESFEPPTPSAAGVPAYLSPGDEKKPRLARRMKMVRHRDGSIEGPRTPPPTKIRRAPPRRGGVLEYAERLGTLAQDKPLLVYGTTAVSAFCLSLMLLGVGGLASTSSSAGPSSSSGTVSSSGPLTPPKGAAESALSEDSPTVASPDKAVAEEKASGLTPGSAEPAPKQDGAPSSAQPSSPSGSEIAEGDPAVMAQELDEAVKHLLAGRYDRAEAAYAALTNKHPDVQEIKALHFLLKRNNEKTPSTSHPVILP